MSVLKWFTGAVLGLSVFAGGCETAVRSATGADRPSGSLAAPAPEPNSMPACSVPKGCLSVLSYNMKHRDVPIQLDAIARQIKTDVAHLPDFILLQEVVFGRPKRLDNDNTAAELAEQIGYHANGNVRNDGAEGLAILSRLPFDHYAFLHLKTHDSLLSGGFPRVSIMGECIRPDLGRVRMVNVHLAYKPSDHDIRRKQLRETLEWMAQRQREMPADVIVLGGDFNIRPGWEEMSILHNPETCGGLAFKDFNSQTPSFGSVGEAYARVDYVFIAAPGRDITDVGEAILWRNGIPTVDGSTRFHPSDHLPLLHVYTIGPAKP